MPATMASQTDTPLVTMPYTFSISISLLLSVRDRHSRLFGARLIRLAPWSPRHPTPVLNMMVSIIATFSVLASGRCP